MKKSSKISSKQKKTCPKCKKGKSRGEFYNNKASSDGLQTYCKVCILRANKACYEKKSKSSTVSSVKKASKKVSKKASKKVSKKQKKLGKKTQVSKEQVGRKRGGSTEANASTKFCKKCDSAKSKDEFYKQANSKDGLQAYCKTCLREYAKKKLKAG